MKPPTIVCPCLCKSGGESEYIYKLHVSQQVMSELSDFLHNKQLENVDLKQTLMSICHKENIRLNPYYHSS